MGNNNTDLNITHKELLTFTNLTNLEWQFVNLEENETDANGITRTRSTKLNDLLSDPKSFVRKNAEGKVEKYEYMEGVKKEEDITPEHLEKGLFQIRQKAGIAMEYLEKSKECDEGKFIQDWEVIYGADNYKIVTDYIDNIYDETQKVIDPSYDPNDQDNRPKLYKSRQELEDIKKEKRWVEIGFEAVTTGLEIKSGFALTASYLFS